MKIEYMTIDEILTRIEQGLIDEVPANIVREVYDEGWRTGYEKGWEEGLNADEGQDIS